MAIDFPFYCVKKHLMAVELMNVSIVTKPLAVFMHNVIKMLILLLLLNIIYLNIGLNRWLIKVYETKNIWPKSLVYTKNWYEKCIWVSEIGIDMDVNAQVYRSLFHILLLYWVTSNLGSNTIYHDPTHQDVRAPLYHVHAPLYHLSRRTLNSIVIKICGMLRKLEMIRNSFSFYMLKIFKIIQR